MEPRADSVTPEDLVSAREAAERFLQAARQGDQAAVEGMMLPIPGQKPDFQSLRDSLQEGEVGAPRVEGEQVVVPITMRQVAEGEKLPQGMQALPLVLARPEGTWKIDMVSTLDRVMDAAFSTMGQVMETMGEAMGKACDAVGEGLSSLSSPDQSPASGGAEEGEER